MAIKQLFFKNMATLNAHLYVQWQTFVAPPYSWIFNRFSQHSHCSRHSNILCFILSSENIHTMNDCLRCILSGMFQETQPHMLTINACWRGGDCVHFFWLVSLHFKSWKRSGFQIQTSRIEAEFRVFVTIFLKIIFTNEQNRVFVRFSNFCSLSINFVRKRIWEQIE